MSDVTAFERWWLDSWPHRWRVRRRVPAFLRACPEPFRGEVLEVGAGSGWTSQTILETFPQVELTATDVNVDVLRRFERMQGRYGRRLKVQVADALQLPFDRASFDVVIAVHVFHHVADVEQALGQLVRVLRPGGLLGILDHDQRLMRGPLKWLWRPAQPLRREALTNLIKQEAEVLAEAGDLSWYCWARKAYPGDSSATAAAA